MAGISRDLVNVASAGSAGAVIGGGAAGRERTLRTHNSASKLFIASAHQADTLSRNTFRVACNMTFLLVRLSWSGSFNAYCQPLLLPHGNCL